MSDRSAPRPRRVHAGIGADAAVASFAELTPGLFSRQSDCTIKCSWFSLSKPALLPWMP